nr:hypothetical protein [Tanacetum cinerariifolium]
EDASPIAQSPEYVPESDLEAHPEDDDDEDPKEDPDDEDDDMDIEADEEEEHPATTDSVVVASTAADQALSTEETEPFETPPPSPIHSLGYQAAMIRLHAEAASTSLPPLQLPSASRREDRPEVTLPPQ